MSKCLHAAHCRRKVKRQFNWILLGNQFIPCSQSKTSLLPICYNIHAASGTFKRDRKLTLQNSSCSPCGLCAYTQKSGIFLMVAPPIKRLDYRCPLTPSVGMKTTVVSAKPLKKTSTKPSIE